MSEKARAELTQARLKELITYDELTGEMVRIASPKPATAGRVVKSMNRKGYLQITLEGRTYGQHRVAWLYAYGAWPDDQIDHIDRNRANNVLKNLRVLTNKQNSQNRHLSNSKNASGLMGVKPSPAGKWVAYIFHSGKTHHIGTFADPHQAHLAYMEEKRIVHPFAEMAKVGAT